MRDTCTYVCVKIYGIHKIYGKEKRGFLVVVRKIDPENSENYFRLKKRRKRNEKFLHIQDILLQLF